MEHLTWLQADADTERRIRCGLLPSDRAHRASATLRLIEGEHPLIAGGDDDRLMRADWAEIVQRLLGVRGHAGAETDSVDTDYGCGVIRKLANPSPQSATSAGAELLGDWRIKRGDPMEAFAFLQAHKQVLLNLITADEFFATERS